jgi:uncharacterized protein (TIGR03435 family)
MIDLTGLKDAYDFTLTWTPKNPRSDIRGAEVGAQAATAPGGLTVFEGVDKLLGLRIAERKHPLPVIAVGRAEK